MTVLVVLCAGGAIFPHSGLGITIMKAFPTIRQDILAALTELWSCFKPVFITFHNTISFVKILELACLDLMLKSLPHLPQFLLKTLDKTPTP